MANDMSQNPGGGNQGKRNARPSVHRDFDSSAPDDREIHDETHEEFMEELRREGSPEALIEAYDEDESGENARKHERERIKQGDEADREREKEREATEAGIKEKFADAASGNDGTPKNAYAGSTLKDYVSYGIKDKGSYYHFNNKKVSDKQLRRMLLRGHLEKGWNTMYFYDKKGKLDHELTGRAQNMLQTFQASKDPRLAEIGRNLSVSGSKMPELEPFLQGKPIAALSKKMEGIGMAWNGKKSEWGNTGLPVARSLGARGASKLIAEVS